jgi:hypothetical protein
MIRRATERFLTPQRGIRTFNFVSSVSSREALYAYRARPGSDAAMKTHLKLFAAIGLLTAFGSACADEAAVRDASGVEVIVVTAKRVAAPDEAAIVDSARRAVSEKKPQIALPQVDVRLAGAPRTRS